MSKVLSIHQAALSRIENGNQNLTAAQLCIVSDYFQIPAHDIITQKINYWNLAERFQQPPPYPKRYQCHYSSKVREILPIISFLNEAYGAETTRSVLEKFGFESALFQNFDQPISVNFTLDLLRELLRNGLLRSEKFELLINQTWSKEVHGPYLVETYNAQDNALKLVQARILNSRYYENNFNYEIEEMKKDHIRISVTPNSHMDTISYQDEILGDFLNTYRKEYFRKFPLYHGFKPLELTEVRHKNRQKREVSYYTLKLS